MKGIRCKECCYSRGWDILDRDPESGELVGPVTTWYCRLHDRPLERRVISDLHENCPHEYSAPFFPPKGTATISDGFRSTTMMGDLQVILPPEEYELVMRRATLAYVKISNIANRLCGGEHKGGYSAALATIVDVLASVVGVSGEEMIRRMMDMGAKLNAERLINSVYEEMDKKEGND